MGEQREKLTGDPGCGPRMAVSVSTATRAGFPQEFSQSLWAGKVGGSLTTSFDTPTSLTAGESRGLGSESSAATCRCDGPAVPDTEGPAASGGAAAAGPCRALCFWLQLVEMFSTCFPMFTELRARNVACGCGGRPDGAWPPESGQVSTSEAAPGPEGLCCWGGGCVGEQCLRLGPAPARGRGPKGWGSALWSVEQRVPADPRGDR